MQEELELKDIETPSCDISILFCAQIQQSPKAISGTLQFNNHIFFLFCLLTATDDTSSFKVPAT